MSLLCNDCEDEELTQDDIGTCQCCGDIVCDNCYEEYHEFSICTENLEGIKNPNVIPIFRP